MKCDIIIPIWNQLENTRCCIDNIVKNTRMPHRLILIDNASDYETKQYLEDLDDSGGQEITLIRNAENTGFVRAVNQGLEISNAPYVCIMNNDTIPAQDWLERMIEFAENHRDVGLVNPQCDGHGGTPIENYAKELAAHKGEYMEMNQCHGFCMLIKREVIDKIGHLDEAFGIGGFDDTDYSMRAHLAGYRSVSVKNSYVYHRLHASFDKAGNREEWVRRNRRIYYGKWGKHLRVAIPVYFSSLNPHIISRLALFIYGLAREWAWVHVWINHKGNDGEFKECIEDTFRKNNLSPHQNIRIDYFHMPGAVFDIMTAGKLLERIRSRMKDKKFDAVLVPEKKNIRILCAVAKLIDVQTMEIPFDYNYTDWLKKGRETASLIRGKKV